MNWILLVIAGLVVLYIINKIVSFGLKLAVLAVFAFVVLTYLGSTGIDVWAWIR